jgi:hypothetical protein
MKEITFVAIIEVLTLGAFFTGSFCAAKNEEVAVIKAYMSLGWDIQDVAIR